MIAPSDLTGVDASLARRVIAVGRSIAPCLDSLTGEPRTDAIAILIAAANEPRAPRGVKSERIGPAAVEYVVDASWFSADDTAALRALCVATSAANPIGSFPNPSRVVSRMWPEDC